MAEQVVKLYPGWKEAASQIVTRVAREGYGIIISFEALFSMMDIQQPETASLEGWQKHQFEVLQSMENLKKTLLEDHNICLHNVRGTGYQVLHPDDQVTIAANKLFRKAMQKVRQAIDVITHVDLEALSLEGQQQQLRQLEKAAFLYGVMSKKSKLPGGSEGGPKSLPN